ncbi:hypothetical protein, partial [Vibrio parahaemolyticus]|uniref:hypothetical protein n=1 Tax=Vibrio parahaemolyticus TaxID=670 RepID=UPI001C609B81
CFKSYFIAKFDVIKLRNNLQIGIQNQCFVWCRIKLRILCFVCLGGFVKPFVDIAYLKAAKTYV